MSSIFTHQFDSPFFKGKSTVNLGLFINNEFVAPVLQETFDVFNPATGDLLSKVPIGSAADVDIAVNAARAAFKTTWGLNCPASTRRDLLNKLADLIFQHQDELVALEALNGGNTFGVIKNIDMKLIIDTFRYYASWAGNNHGQTIETNPKKFAYTRVEPIGVCGGIIPWNFPLLMATLKIAPAVATGCTVVLKPSEMTPLSLLRLCDLIKEAGFPPGVVNVVNGTGQTVGQAISNHLGIDKVSFTGSALVGRSIAKAAADSNLKGVTLELGGKSPNIILDDADLDQAVKWSGLGIFSHAGQVCAAGSRIYVQEGVYDKFLEALTVFAKTRILGSQFDPQTQQGPQVSKSQLERVLSYIDSGKQQGAKVLVGGEQHGRNGYFIQPTIFTDVRPDMKIVQEEVFGPVAIVVKFKTDEEVIELANDTTYGLAAAVFSKNIDRALNIAHRLEAGSVYVNNYGSLEAGVPFGGYKGSGWGREYSQYALNNFTQIKAVHINVGVRL